MNFAPAGFGICVFIITSTVFGGPAVAKPNTRSPITNGATWRAELAIELPGAERPRVESVFVYQPTTEWTYSHHAFLAAFGGRVYAAWANGRRDQDAAGQRVLIASTNDFSEWTDPVPLLVPSAEPDGKEHILSPGGFYSHNGNLILFFSDKPAGAETRHLHAISTKDGRRWTARKEMGVPLVSCYGPAVLSSGTLLMPCDAAFFARSENRGGLTEWNLTGIHPTHLAASPTARAITARDNGWPSMLTEPSFYQTDDGVVHMLLRNSGARRLWLTESRDDGKTWSAPVETEFSNAATKFYFGRLPDRRFFFVGNPIGQPRLRSPLVLSLSRDGLQFNRHFILGEQHYEMRRPGAAKYGEYAYPHAIVHNGYLYVIASRQKEAIEVLRIALHELNN